MTLPRLSGGVWGDGSANKRSGAARLEVLPAIADNKRLGPLLAMIRDEQLRRGPERRSMKAPRRRDQRNARLFKVG